MNTNANTNGTTKLLTALAQSGHQWVQLATVALVALSGIGNFIITSSSSDRNRQEIEINRRVAYEGEQRIRDEVRRQIEDIHKWIRESQDEFHKGNIDTASNKKTLAQFGEELIGFEKRQLVALENQKSILNNQTQILTEIHAFMLERKKQLKQQ